MARELGRLVCRRCRRAVAKVFAEAPRRPGRPARACRGCHVRAAFDPAVGSGVPC